MSFFQFDYLTVYPPSNPNRDDQGRPKTAYFGGVPRLRLSSQSIKRAVRMSEVMQTALAGSLGERTARASERIRHQLVLEGIDEAKARSACEKIANVLGKLSSKDDADTFDGKPAVKTAQLAFISSHEYEASLHAARRLAAGHKNAEQDLAKQILASADTAVDIGMFGRMLADQPGFNREAAVHVSHAITTHKADVEDDYYTAVDDLNTREQTGAGFVGEAGFGSGVYYLHVTIDEDLLLKNLGGEGARELAARAIGAVAEGFATASPSGKRASFAHAPRAGVILARFGNQQPMDLTGAFLSPVRGENLLAASEAALNKTLEQMERIYGPSADSSYSVSLSSEEGSMDGLKRWIAERAHG